MCDICKIFRPTSHIKWFRVEGNKINGEKPLAQIAGYRECGDEWFCLKQLWRSNDGKEEWRDVEVVP